MIRFVSLCLLLAAPLWALPPWVQSILSSTPEPTGGGGVTYDLEENFEAPGEENTWTAEYAFGTFNDSYATSPAPLVGSYSALFSGQYGRYWDTGSDQSDVYFYCVVDGSNFSSGNDGTWSFRTSAGAQIFRVDIRSGTDYTQLTTDGWKSMGDIMASGNAYHVWIEYEAASTFRIYVSSTDTKPGTATYSTSITESGDVRRVRIGGNNGSQSVIFDKIRVSFSAPIGSAPD